MALTVTVKKVDGRVTTDKDLGYLFSTLKNGTYTITIKRASEKRSINQNDLMWMWFSCVERETGTPKNDVYNFYTKKFLQKVVQVGDRLERCVESTSQLNKERFTEFLNKVQADVASEFGIQLPIPEDRYFEQFYQTFNY
jgi:hypothetical protein